jgi:hypothetical protein
MAVPHVVLAGLCSPSRIAGVLAVQTSATMQRICHTVLWAWLAAASVALQAVFAVCGQLLETWHSWLLWIQGLEICRQQMANSMQPWSSRSQSFGLPDVLSWALLLSGNPAL